MSKERWIQAYEELEAELEREPTSEEVDEKYKDNFARDIDIARDRMKYEGYPQQRKPKI